MNPSTITSTSLAVFSGSTPVDVVDGMSISEDSRTITLNQAETPGRRRVITIELTSAIQDLSGILCQYNQPLLLNGGDGELAPDRGRDASGQRRNNVRQIRQSPSSPVPP